MKRRCPAHCKREVSTMDSSNKSILTFDPSVGQQLFMSVSRKFCIGQLSAELPKLPAPMTKWRASRSPSGCVAMITTSPMEKIDFIVATRNGCAYRGATGNQPGPLDVDARGNPLVFTCHTGRPFSRHGLIVRHVGVLAPGRGDAKSITLGEV